MPTAIELAAQFRQRLEAQEVDTAERMALAYNRIYTGDEISKICDGDSAGRWTGAALISNDSFNKTYTNRSIQYE